MEGWAPGPCSRCPPFRVGRPTFGGAMDDYCAKLFAGQMGISAVIANVLVDKGVIGIEEFSSRFHQAHGAASRCSSGPATAHALAEIIRYLDGQLARPRRPSAPSRWMPRNSADARLLD